VSLFIEGFFVVWKICFVDFDIGWAGGENSG